MRRLTCHLVLFFSSGSTFLAHAVLHFSPQLLDIGIATQTPAAQKAMMELLNFEEASNLQYPLRYLLGAAYSTHPGPYLIKDLLVKRFF